MPIRDPLNRREKRHVRDNDPVMSNRDWGIDLPAKLTQFAADIQAEIDLVADVDAFEVDYDDSMTMLGVSNVQDAIEALYVLTAAGTERSVYAPFTFATPSPLVVTTQAANELIVEAHVVIETPFDDPGATVILGQTATPGLVFSGSEVKVGTAARYHSNETFKAVGATNVELTIASGTSTQGSGYVLVRLKKY